MIKRVTCRSYSGSKNFFAPRRGPEAGAFQRTLDTRTAGVPSPGRSSVPSVSASLAPMISPWHTRLSSSSLCSGVRVGHSSGNCTLTPFKMQASRGRAPRFGWCVNALPTSRSTAI